MSKQVAKLELPFTGERLVPQVAETYLQVTFEHLHRYFFARELVQGRTVLDIASGEGFGTSLLAQTASEVIGVDIASDAVRHARQKYRGKNIRFLKGSCLKIPLPDSSVDAIVSFETIEHIKEHEIFMMEIKRVLLPAGILIISTPNVEEYSDQPDYKNPFHVRELYAEQFQELLRGQFKNQIDFGQRMVAGSLILALKHGTKNAKHTFGIHRGDFSGCHFSTKLESGVYCLTVCSDARLPAIKESLFERAKVSAQAWNSLESIRGIHEDLQRAKEDLENKNLLQEKLAVTESELESQRQANTELESKIRELQAEIRSQRDLDRSAHQSTLTALQTSVAENRSDQERIQSLSSKLNETTLWAQSLDAELEKLRASFSKKFDLAEERAVWAQSLEAELEQLKEAFREKSDMAEERAVWAQSLEAELKQLKEAFREKSEFAETQTKWAKSLDNDLTALRDLATKNAEMADERTEWARSLESKLNTSTERIESFTKEYSEIKSAANEYAQLIWGNAELTPMDTLTRGMTELTQLKYELALVHAKLATVTGESLQINLMYQQSDSELARLKNSLLRAEELLNTFIEQKNSLLLRLSDVQTTSDSLQRNHDICAMHLVEADTKLQDTLQKLKDYESIAFCRFLVDKLSPSTTKNSNS